MIKYSLIVPTIARVEEVKCLFDSLEKSTYKDFEVIIVDQNEKYFLKNIVESKNYSFPIFNYRVDFKSATMARNYGIQYAKGEYIMFPDDDCEFFSNTLQVIDKYVMENRADVVCGKCVDRDGNDTVARFSKTEMYLNLKNCNGNYVEVSEIFPRKLLEKFKYNEEIGVGKFFGSSEALDQMIRMLRNNVKVFYTPEIKFYHPSKTIDYSDDLAIKRAFFYACGFSHVCKTHKIKYATKRFVKLLLYIPFCVLFCRSKVKFYLAEFSGLLAGNLISKV